MSEYHVYIDGTWLFSQCGKNSTLTQKTKYPTFRIDFTKLLITIEQHLLRFSGDTKLTPLGKWYYSSCIIDIPDTDADGNDLAWLKAISYSKQKTVESANDAGFDISGFFPVKFQSWMPSRIIGKTFQEKMVDTSLVARMVQSCIERPRDFHVLITGDLDMLPAVSLVVPTYLEKVVLFTIHPDQWDPNKQQTSKRLNDYNFNYGPFYLDNIVSDIMWGEFVYKCGRCNKYFTTMKEIDPRVIPYCQDDLKTRPVRKHI